MKDDDFVKRFIKLMVMMRYATVLVILFIIVLIILYFA